MLRPALGFTISLATALTLPTPGGAGVTWKLSNTPTRGTTIADIAARSNTDVWAVGLRPGSPDCQYQTLTEHWDGSTWKVIDSPSLPKGNSVLDGVTVISAKDAWAVGESGCPADQGRSLTEHWDGRAWSIVKSPDNGSFRVLHDVVGLAQKNVWAVGEQIVKNHDIPLLEHWDGTRWSTVTAPASAGPLLSVSASSASDVWAVGAGNASHQQAPVALHFDGKTWKTVAMPTPPNSDAGLFGVTSISRNDAWAVGDFFPAGGGSGQLLSEHWDGTRWQVVPTPHIGAVGSLSGLFCVEASPAAGVWAVGFEVDDVSAKAVVLQLSHGAWVVANAPNTNSLFALAALPNGNLFAADVGFIFRGVIS